MRYTSWRHLRVSSSLMETRVCLQKETYECLSCLMETRVCLHKETFGCLSCLMETNVCLHKETFECLSCLMETNVCLHKETFECISCLMETNVFVSIRRHSTVQVALWRRVSPKGDIRVFKLPYGDVCLQKEIFECSSCLMETCVSKRRYSSV